MTIINGQFHHQSPLITPLITPFIRISHYHSFLEHVAVVHMGGSSRFRRSNGFRFGWLQSFPGRDSRPGSPRWGIASGSDGSNQDPWVSHQMDTVRKSMRGVAVFGVVIRNLFGFPCLVQVDWHRLWQRPKQCPPTLWPLPTAQDGMSPVYKLRKRKLLLVPAPVEAAMRTLAALPMAVSLRSRLVAWRVVS